VKLLFDQNLSFRLVQRLAAEFPGSAHARDCGLEHASDDELWELARTTS
jgi:predicted nuclease of predicted toxin-antitoxin system